jgi:hypothetical protein
MCASWGLQIQMTGGGSKIIQATFFLGLSKTFDKCSRLFGAWSETVHYRPLIPTHRPRRQEV